VQLRLRPHTHTQAADTHAHPRSIAPASLASLVPPAGVHALVPRVVAVSRALQQAAADRGCEGTGPAYMEVLAEPPAATPATPAHPRTTTTSTPTPPPPPPSPSPSSLLPSPGSPLRVALARPTAMAALLSPPGDPWPVAVAVARDMKLLPETYNKDL
jgi:hypothetical protein